MKIEVIKKINEGDPDYDAIGEPYYYKVKIDGKTIYSRPLKTTTDYYPPDPNDDSEINDGALPSLYGRLSNNDYYSLLSQVKKAAHFWEIKHKLSSKTLETFNDLIDEL
jgi:hypothetical protein